MMHIHYVNHELVMDQLVMDKLLLVEFEWLSNWVRNEDMNEIIDLKI
jgi:hypothetical protein